ncbi:hypothetical protein ACHQM5_004165 [Ranunculus cassubicifolius]
MDLTPFKSDIDELINDFTQSHSTTLSHLKTLWISRKFTFIYESKPTTNIAFFMQSLFAHSIHHILSPTSFSQRLAGLYTLYCLHQTQPCKPPFKIYLSLAELKKLKGLVVEAKGRNVKDVAAVVKRMYEKDVFMFGAIEMNDGFVSERVNEVMDLQNARVEMAYEKLVRDTPIERVVVEMDLGRKVDVKAMRKLEKEYESSKGRAIAEAGEIVDVQDVMHIAEREKLFGDVMERVVEDWNTQKDVFCQQTGFSTRRQSDEDNNGSNDAMNVEEVDEFGKELELLLFNGSR